MGRFDNAELLGCFKAEAAERLQKLNDGILALEKEGMDDSVLDALFREAHTLKGAAAMIGCADISALAHGFEDVLSGLKNGDVAIGKVAGVLFQCCDAIKEILESLDGLRESEVDVEKLLRSFDRLLAANLEENSGDLKKKDTKETPEEITEEATEETTEDIPVNREGSLSSRNQKTNRRSEEMIHVATDKLDGLANTVGEIVISRAKLAGSVDVLRHLSDVVSQQNRAIGETIDLLAKSKAIDNESVSEELTAALNKYKESNKYLAELVLSAYGEQHDTMCRFETIIDQLDSDVTALRMRPISTVFDLFPRIVRDLAEEYGKSVDLKIEGGETELDRSMLEGIKDPLMHLLRNAVDHGIESRQNRVRFEKPEKGTLGLSAKQEGDRIFITLSDDGRGIDTGRIKATAIRMGIINEESAGRMTDDDALALIFTPGFTTKTTVTDVSGRGVGTDVVRKYVEDNLHGQVMVDSKVNRGTTFTLVLPLTLAVTPSVLVRAGGQLFAIPAHSVQLGARVSAGDIRSTDGKLAANINGSSIPLVRLEQTLLLPSIDSPENDSSLRDRENEQLEVLVVEHGNRRLAFIIDELVEEQDIVVKRLDPPLNDLKFVAGVTILEKGEIVPILHVHEIIEAGESAGSAHGGPESVPTQEGFETRRNVLVVEDSRTTRELMKNIIRSAGYNVEAAADGVEALNKLASQQLDLIVTDIEMPRMDGFEMTERVKRDPTLKDIPVIIVTSLFRDEERKRGMEVGADAYIRKGDFDQSKLVDTIKRLVV
jgi:two-component system chemotaxis sensor kinase CheA